MLFITLIVIIAIKRASIQFRHQTPVEQDKAGIKQALLPGGEAIRDEGSDVKLVREREPGHQSAQGEVQGGK